MPEHGLFVRKKVTPPESVFDKYFRDPAIDGVYKIWRMIKLLINERI